MFILELSANIWKIGWLWPGRYWRWIYSRRTSELTTHPRLPLGDAHVTDTSLTPTWILLRETKQSPWPWMIHTDRYMLSQVRTAKDRAMFMRGAAHTPPVQKKEDIKQQIGAKTYKKWRETVLLSYNVNNCNTLKHFFFEYFTHCRKKMS